MPTRRGERAMSDLERSEWSRLLGRLAEKYTPERVVRYIRQALSDGLFQRVRSPREFGNFVAEIAVDPSERGWQPSQTNGRWEAAYARCQWHAREASKGWPDEVRWKVMSECYADLTSAAVHPNATDEQIDAMKRAAKTKAWQAMGDIWTDAERMAWSAWRQEVTAEVANRTDWRHLRKGA